MGTRCEIPLLVESLLQILPLGDISWENFERLCDRLITKYVAIFDYHRYGKPGEDQQSADVLFPGWRDGQLLRGGYQRKRYESFSASDVTKAVSSFKYKADVYAILLSAVVSTDMRNKVSSHLDVHLRDREDLSRKLRENPDIVADFSFPHCKKASIELRTSSS
jgi:hypothetical protein